MTFSMAYDIKECKIISLIEILHIPKVYAKTKILTRYKKSKKYKKRMQSNLHFLGICYIDKENHQLEHAFLHKTKEGYFFQAKKRKRYLDNNEIEELCRFNDLKKYLNKM